MLNSTITSLPFRGGAGGEAVPAGFENVVEADNVAMYFKEFEPFIGKCKFGLGCKHKTEPGCAVLQAVQDGHITQERYDSWSRISEEIRTGSWED